MTSPVALLAQALGFIPDDVVSEATTAADVRDYLAHDEWEVALSLLEELGDSARPPAQFWDLLVHAGQLMRADDHVTLCRWWAGEARNGVIRAEFELTKPAGGGRQEPVPGRGQFRPLWNIGHRDPGGQAALSVARVWVEWAPSPAPGGSGAVRLAPLVPEQWRHLAAGDIITMHEGGPAVGTAMIIETWPPITEPGFMTDGSDGC